MPCASRAGNSPIEQSKNGNLRKLGSGPSSRPLPRTNALPPGPSAKSPAPSASPLLLRPLHQQSILDGGDDLEEARGDLLAKALLAQDIGRCAAGHAVKLVAQPDGGRDGVDVALPLAGDQAEAVGLHVFGGGADAG